MAGVNKQIGIGNLGADPELRHTQGGTAVCNLRVAVNERVKRGGDWQDHTEWFTVVCFGTTAENAAKYLQKGRQVYFEGPSRFREYQKKDGSTGHAREVTANVLTFLGGGGGGGDGDGGGGGGGNQPRRQPQQQQGGDDGFYDDDLPF
jgi:single-strand DNA-binding protein